MAENIPDMDDILAQMKENFIETAHEKLDRMNEILEIFISGNGQNSALQEELRREIHSLKGLGGTFQMPMVSKLCHAFEEFLQPEVIFNPELSIQSQAFVDRIIAFMHDDKMNIATNKQDWLEGLPSKKEVSLQASDESIPLVLLSCEDPGLLDLAKTSFTKNGFKVMATTSPFEAYEIAIRKKPNIVVVSQMFSVMDGAELLRSLSATRELSKSKYAMICPDRRKALEEKLQAVQLLSEKNIENDLFNFIAIVVTP